MPASPTVLWSAEPGERDGTPLVVALHGRGADETSFAGLHQHLPEGVTVASVRAPISEGGGYAWFANRGIGRPVAESIAGTAAQLTRWLDEVQPHHSSVSLFGFSGGTAMAGGLLLLGPDRYASAVLLAGTLPWEAGFPTEPGRLDGVRILYGRGELDQVIPADLIERTVSWLRDESGADLTERLYPGVGHGITAEELADVRAFLASVL
ncbi:MAG: phospholipase/carboxylesterase [Actinomycetota bacterium]|jgi:phospholipase/carboxylesterase|nr:phospholipase/carboxylesterase [Actinomycetota bacterium]MDQ1666727.1 phospholipase/carboxylesterase [Actinomycetota bacterium]